MQLGGAERVLVDLSNELCSKYDITIFSIYDNGELKEDLNKKIKFKSLYSCRYEDLSKLKKIWIPIKILLFSKFIYYKNIKSDCDIEVAFLEGPITRLFSKKNKNTKKIAWIHNDMKNVFGNGLKAGLKKLIDQKIYNKYDDLIFVSKENMSNFKELYKNVNSKKLRVIYNYINKDLVVRKAEKQKDVFGNDNDKKIISVCRLVEQKAIDRFVMVHSKMINNGYKYKVFIVGDGPEKERLQKLIETEKVADSFILLGKKENPYPYIKEADYFCLLSYFEGYGMVLEEAKVLNKKIIITDTAAREAIEGYKNGIILKNNEDAIYDGLCKILNCNDEMLVDDNYEYENKGRVEEVINLFEE